MKSLLLLLVCCLSLTSTARFRFNRPNLKKEMFLIKSLFVCINLKADFLESNIISTNLVRHLKECTTCFARKWDQCLLPRSFKAGIKKVTAFRGFPCESMSVIINTQHTWHVTTYISFQFNLTFVSFHLQGPYPDCPSQRFHLVSGNL